MGSGPDDFLHTKLGKPSLWSCQTPSIIKLYAGTKRRTRRRPKGLLLVLFKVYVVHLKSESSLQKPPYVTVDAL